MSRRWGVLGVGLLLTAWMGAGSAVAGSEDQIEINSWREGNKVRYQIEGLGGLSPEDRRTALEYLSELRQVCTSKGEVGYLAVLGRREQVPMQRVLRFVDAQAQRQDDISHAAVLDFKRVVRDGYRTALDPERFGRRVYNICMLYGNV